MLPAPLSAALALMVSAFALTFAILGITPSLALDEEKPASGEARPQLSDIAEGLAARGLRVLKVERERDLWEVEYVDRDGNLIEADLDPLSGHALRTQNEGRAAREARPGWLTVAEVARRLAARGYEVREVDTERTGFEARLVDRNGKRLEVFVDPVTGEIIGPKQD